MKLRLVFLMLTTAMRLVAQEPSLPAWDSKERDQMMKDGWMAGGILLEFDSLPEDEKQPDRELEGVEARPEELEIVEVDNWIDEKFLVAYFAEKSSSFLVDPQGLLEERDRKDIEGFLDYHSLDSAIAMYVYVFGKDQEIPSEVREEEIVERLYSVGKPAVVVYYYLGVPQRTSVYVSPVVTDAVSATEQIRALESSVIKALSRVDEMEQLEAFLVQMSIRIYWMERMTVGTASETMESKPGEQVSKILHRAKKAEISLTEKVKPWLGVSVGGLAVLLGFLLVVWSLLMWIRMSRRNVFPELEVEKRLGGNHAAGIGAVISFSSSSVSPSSQRDQVPESMNRS